MNTHSTTLLLPCLAVLLGLVMGTPLLPAADPPSATLRRDEFKMLVSADNTAQAIQALKLQNPQASKQIICFFDTPDQSLAAKHLILRGRQTGPLPGESTVKIRDLLDETKLTAAERSIPIVWEWTSEALPIPSRSRDGSPLADGLVANAAAGKLPVTDLFNDEQRQLVSARMGDFKWADLVCYGPVESLVWRQKWQAKGFPNKVTIELWHLRKDGKTLELLELSAKANTTSEDQARALAKQFYAAAKAAGLGDPSGQMKTRMALDFFKPGLNHP